MRWFVRALVCLALVVPALAAADEFDRYHPDQHFRRLAFESFERGKKAEAVPLFLKSARYADKASQLALAMIHWQGDGVAQDRARGYAWADLAAERGYPDFVAIRERYWAELTPEEQQRAQRDGAALADEYGDAKAKKRLELLMKQGLSRKTGTRTGSGVASVASVQVDASARATMIAAMFSSGLNNSGPGIDPKQQATNQMNLLTSVVAEVGARPSANYYSDANWRPKQYWAYQDAMWNELDGIVEVKAIKRGGGELKAE